MDGTFSSFNYSGGVMDDTADEEASQAAYCLLAMSRAGRGAQDVIIPLNQQHQTVMEYQSRRVTAVPAAAAGQSNDPAQFMIARILADLDRVRQQKQNERQGNPG